MASGLSVQTRARRTSRVSLNATPPASMMEHPPLVKVSKGKANEVHYSEQLVVEKNTNDEATQPSVDAAELSLSSNRLESDSIDDNGADERQNG